MVEFQNRILVHFRTFLLLLQSSLGYFSLVFLLGSRALHEAVNFLEGLSFLLLLEKGLSHVAWVSFPALGCWLELGNLGFGNFFKSFSSPQELVYLLIHYFTLFFSSFLSVMNVFTCLSIRILLLVPKLGQVLPLEELRPPLDIKAELKLHVSG